MHLTISTFFVIVVRLNTGRSYGAKIMKVPISTNSSLLRSLAYRSPVRDVLFVEINHKQTNEPHRGDLHLNVIKINRLNHI